MDLWTDGGPPRGRALLWKHGNYLDAEDAALRAWLHKGEDELRSRANPRPERRYRAMPFARRIVVLTFLLSPIPVW
jgi:hypothetical protein